MPRSPSRYRHGELAIVIDCADLDVSAGFWCEALGYHAADPASEPYRSLLPDGQAGIEVLLQRVPDVKSGKTRIHLDLRTEDLDREVARLRGLGAAQLTSEPRAEEGWRWHILADPDGNEFCVLRPPAGKG